MSEKVTLILQGKCDAYTVDIARHYSKLPWAKVIISCWDWDNQPHRQFDTYTSKEPSNPGIGNRNYQIVSSLTGILNSKTQISAKLRSDQKISLESLELMKARAEQNADKIMVAGFYKPFAFHPRDHIFWGKTEDLRGLFEIPLDEVRDSGVIHHDAWPSRGFYADNLRAEAYIAGKYLAKKDSRALLFMQEPEVYMYDFCPKRDYALQVSEELMNKYFAPFPKIDFEWPKHGLKSYHYDFAASHYGEYWSE